MRSHSGCHGNLAAVEMKQVAGACCPKKPSWEIWNQYDLRLWSYWGFTLVAMET